MGEYISELLWQSIKALPKTFGQEWSTIVVSFLPAAIYWFIRRFRKDRWRGLLTLPVGARKRVSELFIFVGVWFLVVLVIFGYTLLDLAYKRDAEQRAQIVELTKTMVSIECVPVLLPLRGRLGDSLNAIYLHPNAVNQLPYFMFGSAPEATFWPSARARGVGYKCEVINDGSPLSKLELALQVDFGTAAGSQQNRTIEFTLPPSRNNRPFVLHIANCTVWSPHVVLPETGLAQVRGMKGMHNISIGLSARRLAVFGHYSQDSPENAPFCGTPT